MRPRLGFIAAAIRLGGLMVILLLCFAPFQAAESQRGMIVCREEVPRARRAELERQLQLITGWRDLNFDEHGAIRPVGTTANGGSNSARTLLAKTLASETVLIIEDASNRADVVFARVVPGRWKHSAAENRKAFVVLIDFADFDRLLGDRPALAAFNAGWSLLHEIDHVVNESVDSEVVGHAGECEDHINQMRRECHLPSRLDYFYRYFPNTEQSEFRTRIVRLAFELQEQPAKKQRRFWVIWDAAEVGGLDSSGQVVARK